MPTFIDESGETGTLSPYFRLAAVWFPTHDDVETFRAGIRQFQKSVGLEGYEYKSSKSLSVVRKFKGVRFFHVDGIDFEENSKGTLLVFQEWTRRKRDASPLFSLAQLAPKPRPVGLWPARPVDVAACGFIGYVEDVSIAWQ